MNIKHSLMGLVAATSIWHGTANAGVSCSISSKHIWNTGYQLHMTIKNTGSTSISSWGVHLQFAQSPQITQSWSVALQGDKAMLATNLNWNGFLVPNQTTTFGFIGNHNGNFVLPTCSENIPLAIPQLPIGPDASIGTFSLTWASIPNATRYQVQETTLDSAGAPTQWQTIQDSAATQIDVALKPVGRLGYRVRECVSDGRCSDFSPIKKIAIFNITSPSLNSTGSYTVTWSGGDANSQLMENNLVVSTAAASGSMSFTNKATGTYRYTLSGFGDDAATTQVDNPAFVDVNRSLFIHDTATLDSADFSLRSVLEQLVTQFNAGNRANPTTAEQLFARMWDTQNPAPGLVSGGEKCTGTLNGFPIECRPDEGAQARDPLSAIANYRPIGLVNRFDLRDQVTFKDCGEYRVVYGLNSNTNSGRNFIIFEAQLPNPQPGQAAGCLPIAQFWKNLSTQTDDRNRAILLRDFYFNGLAAANVAPVIDIKNYADTTGQIRTNMFIAGNTWVLKEFKTDVDANGISMIRPVTVKSNPLSRFFDGAASDSTSLAFQREFLNNLPSLLGSLDSFSLNSSDQFNNGQSHASGPIGENDFPTIFSNTPNSVFANNLSARLQSLGSNLTSAQLVNRATAMTCGGCHQPGFFGINQPNAVGPNQRWPDTLGFVHVSEFVSFDGTFPLSPALTEVFLPARLQGLVNYLNTTTAPAARSFAPLRASQPANTSTPLTGKRSG